MATEMNNQTQPPEEHVFSKEEHRRILVILFALMLGMFLAALDQSIVSTALPTIAGDSAAISAALNPCTSNPGTTFDTISRLIALNNQFSSRRISFLSRPGQRSSSSPGPC